VLGQAHRAGDVQAREDVGGAAAGDLVPFAAGLRQVVGRADQNDLEAALVVHAQVDVIAGDRQVVGAFGPRTEAILGARGAFQVEEFLHARYPMKAPRGLNRANLWAANGCAAFIPWFPLAAGRLAEAGSILDFVAKAHVMGKQYQAG